MKLEDLKHLPVARCPLLGDKEVDLPEVPVELADVEFKGNGYFRPIYVRGILIPDENPNVAYLIWANHISVQTGKRDTTLKTRLEEITSYKVQVRARPFS